MLNEYARERVRRAYDLEKKSVYQIAKEDGCCHQAIERANFDSLHYRYDPLEGVLSCQYQLSEAISAPQPRSSERRISSRVQISVLGDSFPYEQLLRLSW